jgi:tetratricopeptide (TPR) repeat protein
VLLVATAREEELADADVLRRALGELRGEGHLDEVVLSPLSRPDTSSLVRFLTVAGSEARAVARLEEQAWAASEGNPFVVVETVRALREGLTLREPATLSLPQRVRDVVAARVQRLSDRSRELLSVAAVIGREFDFALLQRASGLTERDAAASVEELVRRRMLHGVDEGFDFTHDRIREVVYGALLPPRRKLLHADVAAALETLTAGALDPPAAALGLHYRHAEVWDKAVVYLRQAGLTAAARSALQDARVWFEQALAALVALPRTSSTLEQAFEIRLELRTVLIQLGEYRTALERLHEAEALAETLNDNRRRGRVCGFLTTMLLQLGDLDEARAFGTRALAIAGELGDLELRILSTSFLGVVHHHRGEYEQQLALVTDNLAALPADWVYKDLGAAVPVSIFDRVQMVHGLAQLGRFAEAAEYEAEVIRLAESTHHAYTVGLAHLAAGMLHLHEGNWSKARSPIERSVSVLRTGEVLQMLSAAIASSAWTLAQLGRGSEALDRLREAEQLLERQETKGGQRGWAYHSLGRTSLLLGRLDEAQRLGDRAIASSPPGSAPHALNLLGDIATHPDRFDAERGETRYREALALAEPRGMRPLVARCHLGLGQMYGRLGKRDQSREHLGTATTMFREMDMPFWLEQAEAALREVAPPAAAP